MKLVVRDQGTWKNILKGLLLERLPEPEHFRSFLYVSASPEVGWAEGQRRGAEGHV